MNKGSGKGKGKDTSKGKGTGKGPKRSTTGGGSGTTTSTLQYVLKFLASEALASAIIGKGGAVIEEIRTSCSVRLGLTDYGEFYPGTECRVVTAQADEQDSLEKVCSQIVSKVAELSKSASSSGSDGAANSDGELKLRTLVPRAAVGGIIGKGGAAVKQLRETTGANISIGDAVGSGPGAEQTVAISGSSKGIEDTLKEINKQIQSLSTETWFQQWASSTGIAAAGYGQSSLLGPSPYGGILGNSAPGVDLMMRVAHNLPPYVMEDSRGFALSCVVPNRLVGGLIGRGGAGTKEVQTATGTKIGIRDIPGDTENRSMNIAGPLANTCAAYMMMMKRYLEVEASTSEK